MNQPLSCPRPHWCSRPMTTSRGRVLSGSFVLSRSVVCLMFDLSDFVDVDAPIVAAIVRERP